jgi:enamine deaminase RidA (YjgF/YER057c/UK114 family)
MFRDILFALLAVATALSAQTTVRHIQTQSSGIASAVWAGDTLYVSGQLASPASQGVWGDTKTQAASALSKIEALLKEQGLGMGDVVMMHVYLVGDPSYLVGDPSNGGKMDFAGLNAAYGQFFGTKDQPNKPARTTVQVAALAQQGPLVEIEVIAVRPK